MPIRGLTDRPKPKLPRMGIIRKGAPKTGNVPGRDLTYFRFQSDDPWAEDAWRINYADPAGGEPRTLGLWLAPGKLEDIWESWQEEWVAGGLVHRCDGEWVALYQDKTTGSYVEPPPETVPCPWGSRAKKPLTRNSRNDGCKAVGRLSVILPKIRRMATVTVLTTSITDLITLSESLAVIDTLSPNGPGMQEVVLQRVPRQIRFFDQKKGKRITMIKHCLVLEPSMSLAEGLLAPGLPAGNGEAYPALDEGDLPVVEIEGLTEDDLEEEDVEEREIIRRAFHAAGNQLWGEAWRDQRHGLVMALGIESGSSKDLTTKQLQEIAEQLRQHLSRLSQNRDALKTHLARVFGANDDLPKLVDHILGEDQVIDVIRLQKAVKVALGYAKAAGCGLLEEGARPDAARDWYQQNRIEPEEAALDIL